MFRAIACAASLALCCEAAFAKDLGVRGAVFPVAEPDLFADIAVKFAALEASGEADRVNERLRQRALAVAERPPRVEGVVATQEPRSFHVDLTVVLTADITTPDGHVIGRAGETFNPLHHTPMDQRIVFFDGDDPAQVEWARAEIDQAAVYVSPVLIGGPVLELTRQWERQVFFDQGGALTRRLGVTHVPARVRRDGDLLLVEEVAP